MPCSKENHPNWTGGKYLRKDGYIQLNVYGLPFSDGKQFMLEHRYVMAKHLKRKLKKTEAVHHKNGNRVDNRLENLEIMSFHDHWVEHHGHRKGAHFTLKERECAWCKKRFYPVGGYNGSTQKFCSKSCAQRWLWKNNPPLHRKTRKKDKILKRICKFCAKSYIPIGNWQKRSFCSISCGVINRKIKKVPIGKRR